jgi:hypothetical protein
MKENYVAMDSGERYTDIDVGEKTRRFWELVI